MAASASRCAVCCDRTESCTCNREDVRLVLIGKTGVGKSSSGNTILDRDVFPAISGAASVTQNCQLGQGCQLGKDITVVDTPGFFDTELSNDAIGREIQKCVALCAPGPHALVLVTSVGRFTQEERDSVQLFRLLFGKEIANHMVVLFTRKDDLENDGLSIEEYLSDVPEALKTLLTECGGRYVAFNNKGTPAEKSEQVRQLLEVVDDMVIRNCGKCYTTEMLEIAEKIMREREQELRREFDTKKQQVQDEVLEIEERYRKQAHQYEREKQKLKRELEQLQSQNDHSRTSEISHLRQEVASLTQAVKDIEERAANDRAASEQQRLKTAAFLNEAPPNFRHQAREEVCQNKPGILKTIMSGIGHFVGAVLTSLISPVVRGAAGVIMKVASKVMH